MDIDFVIPWVDGGDSKWLKEKEKYDGKCEGDKRDNRFRDWDNLQYLFRGIEKNLPWIRKVHFVTWGHLPEWLKEDAPKLNIVRHEDFIPKEYLPVFSSHPIELNMHRIEGLAEHFIYGNDDIFFMEPLKEEDFFQNGLPCDCPLERVHVFKKGGIDHIVANDLEILNDHFRKRDTIRKYWKKWFSLKYGRFVLKNLYFLPVAEFPGFSNPHLPNAFLKHNFEEVWEAEPDVLKKTSASRFRNNGDVNQWLVRYWQLAKGEFSPGNMKIGKFYSIGKEDREIEYAVKNGQYKMLCLSDDMPDLDFESEKVFIRKVLEAKFPEKSSFEK